MQWNFGSNAKLTPVESTVGEYIKPLDVSCKYNGEFIKNSNRYFTAVRKRRGDISQH